MAELEGLAKFLAKLAELVRAVEATSTHAGSAAVQCEGTGPLGLLVLQPTPFCNLDCDYCYLSDRTNRARMSMETLAAVMVRVFESGLVGERLSVVWHGGEPLALPPRYYEDAFDVIDRLRPRAVAIEHHFQTNAVALTARWCEFIVAHDVQMGLSIDGPAFLHDGHRKTRSGRGTHRDVMASVALLREYRIPFHVICVLTRESLGHADEIFEFFRDHGMDRLGFNVEEIEAANRRSHALEDAGADKAFAAFWNRIIERVGSDGVQMRIREIEDVILALRDPEFGRLGGNSQNSPMSMLTVGYQGEVTTFSPELLGCVDAFYGPLSFANVHATSLVGMREDQRFQRISADVSRGVAMCRESCKYFAFCLGGAPANKLAENGTFASTETRFCRLTQQILVECVLHAIERDRLPGRLLGGRAK